MLTPGVSCLASHWQFRPRDAAQVSVFEAVAVFFEGVDFGVVGVGEPDDPFRRSGEQDPEPGLAGSARAHSAAPSTLVLRIPRY